MLCSEETFQCLTCFFVFCREMDAPKLLTQEAQRQICFTKGKNMVSRRDDGILHVVASFMHAYAQFSQEKDIRGSNIRFWNSMFCHYFQLNLIMPPNSESLSNSCFVTVVALCTPLVTRDFLFFIPYPTINLKTTPHPAVENE